MSVPDRVADLQVQLDSHQAQPARATQLMQPASGHMHVWHPHACLAPTRTPSSTFCSGGRHSCCPKKREELDNVIDENSRSTLVSADLPPKCRSCIATLCYHVTLAVDTAAMTADSDTCDDCVISMHVKKDMAQKLNRCAVSAMSSHNDLSFGCLRFIWFYVQTAG